MKTLLKLIIVALITAVLFTGSSAVFAGTVDDEGRSQGGLTPIPSIPTLPGPDLSDPGQVEKDVFTTRVLPNLAVTLIGYVAIATFLMLTIAGVRYATSYGEEEANEKAKNQIIYALLGFIIALLAYTIVRIVISLDFGTQDSTDRLNSGNNGDDRTTVEEAIDNQADRVDEIGDEIEELNE